MGVRGNLEGAHDVALGVKELGLLHEEQVRP